MTMRNPSRSDSSRRSETPSIRRPRTSQAIRSINDEALTRYGMSVMMICVAFCDVSISVRARMVIYPRPVS